MRLGDAPRSDELHEDYLSCLKLGMRQASAKQFVSEPEPIGVEHIAASTGGLNGDTDYSLPSDVAEEADGSRLAATWAEHCTASITPVAFRRHR